MPAYGVMFHHFYNETHPKGQGAISAQDLVELLNHLGRQNILPADEWMRRALAGALRENDLCLTFDDALLCQFEIAFPVLGDMGLTAFWFVYSAVFEGIAADIEVYRYFRTVSFSTVDEFYDSFMQYVAKMCPKAISELDGFDPDRYLAGYPFYTKGDRIFRYLRDDVLGDAGYNEVMQLMMSEKGFSRAAVARALWMDESHLGALKDAGHLIGLHSYSHPTRLASLSREAQRDQYQRNMDQLEKALGEKPTCMSHPSDSYSAETLRILQDLGVKLGFRANMRQLPNPSPLEFPRQDHAMIMKEMRG